LFGNRWTVFLVTGSLVQDQPDQSTLPMGNGPDGFTAPANQLRLSFVGSEDGEAETETCRAAKSCGETCTVVWQGRTSNRSPYADCPHIA
jgi:hypothetical protein